MLAPFVLVAGADAALAAENACVEAASAALPRKSPRRLSWSDGMAGRFSCMACDTKGSGNRSADVGKMIGSDGVQHKGERRDPAIFSHDGTARQWQARLHQWLKSFENRHSSNGYEVISHSRRFFLADPQKRC
ncbi:hypothetical protein [Sphingobium sp.]|uniref:hypothetical protein n=1 Tax=Sphingobium sp. TaxID=1912891 RepID=UPI003BB4B231